MNSTTKRSVLAIVTGLLVIIVVTTGVDVLLHAAGVFPPLNVPIDDKLALLATAYRIVISIGGAYLTARMAPREPMKHALILGALGTFLGLLGVVATWGKGLGPTWYPVGLAVLAIPQCWAGARLLSTTKGLSVSAGR